MEVIFSPVYEELGLEIPETWDEFMANNATIAAEADGVAPVMLRTRRDAPGSGSQGSASARRTSEGRSRPERPTADGGRCGLHCPCRRTRARRPNGRRTDHDDTHPRHGYVGARADAELLDSIVMRWDGRMAWIAHVEVDH